MKLEYVPLLQKQRELYAMPRGMERFREYLRVMVNDDGDDLEFVPLVIMNPMGKEHLAAALDVLLSADADDAASRAACEAAAKLGAPGEFKASLVLADDAKGGGTNRFTNEYNFRAGCSPGSKRYWITGVMWSSEVPIVERAVETMLTAVYRTAYVIEHGRARNLRELLAQEGDAMASAGCTRPTLDDDELAYTREVLREYLEANDMRTGIECLFGDDAAHALGFTPRGFAPWAGVALALHDARERG